MFAPKPQKNVSILAVTCLVLMLARHSVGIGLRDFLPRYLFAERGNRKCAQWLSLDRSSLLTEEEKDLVSRRACLKPGTDVQKGIPRYNGIPPGVTCRADDWCDATACTTVCERGSVELDEWLVRAHALQNKLAASQPFCFATWLGSHNSAITLSDGYGNLDPLYQSMFDYLKIVVPEGSSTLLRTNDQWFSLTDQLNMGVRVIEIDTHWVSNKLRIAHCGGLHVDALNEMVRLLNAVAKLLGYQISWDTETVGCNPSLSSIPAQEQRPLVDALQEIKDWLEMPEHADEFVFIMLDDQSDLKTWGLVPLLLETISSTFDSMEIFTADSLSQYGGIFPSVSEMHSKGYRVLFASATDYGPSMSPLVFPRSDVCNWSEPSMKEIQGPPQCIIQMQDVGKFQEGHFIRTPSCQIQYGPLNCDFLWKPNNSPILDEATMPEMLKCGMNIPSPDLLTPERSASAIWTWAPGYPAAGDASAEMCVFISASDGRWRTLSCGTEALPTACRAIDVQGQSTLWIIGNSKRGECPTGSIFYHPRHPAENFALQRMLALQGKEAAWLPIFGPHFETQS